MESIFIGSRSVLTNSCTVSMFNNNNNNNNNNMNNNLLLTYPIDALFWRKTEQAVHSIDPGEPHSPGYIVHLPHQVADEFQGHLDIQEACPTQSKGIVKQPCPVLGRENLPTSNNHTLTMKLSYCAPDCYQDHIDIKPHPPTHHTLSS